MTHKNQENLSQLVNESNIIQDSLPTDNIYSKSIFFRDSDNNNTKENLEKLTQPVNSNLIQDRLFTQDPKISQDADKENNFLSLADNISERFLNDSDIVLGTEDCARHTFRSANYELKCPKMQPQHNFSVLENKELEENEVDPDAPTQPYKTPVLVKQTPLATTSHVYSVVSNPTDSELKKVNNIFVKDELFLNETPKSITPWNSSGIKELEIHTIKLNNDIDSICTYNQSQKIKDKCNKSRRMLDFIAEDSQSNDMFDAIVGNKTVIENMESKEVTFQTTATNNEGDVLKGYEKSQSEKLTVKQLVDNVSNDKCSVPVTSHSLQTASKNNTSNDIVNTQVNVLFEDRVSIPQCIQLSCNIQSKTSIDYLALKLTIHKENINNNIKNFAFPFTRTKKR